MPDHSKQLEPISVMPRYSLTEQPVPMEDPFIMSTISTDTTDTAYYNPLEEHSTSSLLPNYPHFTDHNASAQWDNKKISKHYNIAQGLYSSKQFREAFRALYTLILPKTGDSEDANGLSISSNDVSPVERAKSSLRIKIWLLYLKLLDALILNETDEQPESDIWAQITSDVKTGDVWGGILQYGYSGGYANVEAEVVYFTAQLVSYHAPNQLINQNHIECYLTAAEPPGPTSSDREIRSYRSIIMLLATQVLPRNNQLDYAREFISNNDTLTPEQRDEALQMLEPSTIQQKVGEADLDSDHKVSSRVQGVGVEKERGLRRQLQDLAELENDKAMALAAISTSTPTRHPVDSEKDFGIENSEASNSMPQPAAKSSMKPSSTPKSTQNASSSPVKASKKPPTPTSIYKRSTIFMNNLQRFVTSFTQSVSRNPMALMRFVLFLVGLVAALSRRDVKERIKQAMEKVQRTIGMGVKVNYI